MTATLVPGPGGLVQCGQTKVQYLEMLINPEGKWRGWTHDELMTGKDNFFVSTVEGGMDSLQPSPRQNAVLRAHAGLPH